MIETSALADRAARMPPGVVLRHTAPIPILRLAIIPLCCLSLTNLACGRTPELTYAEQTIAIGDRAALAALRIDSLESSVYGNQLMVTMHHIPDSTVQWTQRIAQPFQDARHMIIQVAGDIQLTTPPDRLRTVDASIQSAMALLDSSTSATFAELVGFGFGTSTTNWNVLFVAADGRRAALIEYSRARDRLRRLVPGAAKAIPPIPILDSAIVRYPLSRNE